MFALMALAVSCHLVVESDKFRVHDDAAGGGGAGGYVPDCGQSSNCDTCQGCTVGPDAECADAATECGEVPECGALLDCVAGCIGQPSCFQTCGALHAGGIASAAGLAQCIYCGPCAQLCPVEHSTVCSGG